MWSDAVPVLMSVLVPAAGAVAWWIARADKREDRMIKKLEKDLEKAEAAARAEEMEKELWERRATRWHQQLLDHQITPDPRWGDPV